MKMSREDMVVRVRDMLNEDVASFWTDTQIEDSILEGVRFIASLTQAIQSIVTVTTSAGNREVIFIGTKVHYVEYNGVSLRRIAVKSFGNIPTNTSAPEFFFPQDEALQVEPIPDDAYPLTLYVSSTPSNMVEDTDTTDLPISYDLTVVHFATMKGFMEEGNVTMAKTMENMMMGDLGFHEVDKSTYYVEDTRSIKAPIISEPRSQG